jgi:tryptophan synthase alpha chain
MTPVERLEAALRTPKSETALVAYLTAGWPTKEGFSSLLCAVAEVADAVEIGVPFSDPMADGPTIQRTSCEALEQGVTLEGIFAELSALPTPPAAPILLMGYLNPFLAFGLQRLGAVAAAAGVSAFIVPDLPLDEAADFRALIEPHGLGLVQLVTPATTPARMVELVAASRGFVYAVTVMGITGGDGDAQDGIGRSLREIKAMATVPVMAGFGIRRPEHVAAMAADADGVIVGSALLDCIRAGDDPVDFLRTLSGSKGVQI